MKLSILIPYTQKRVTMLNELLAELKRQINNDPEIEILLDDSEYDSIGEKRNRLLQKATGKYLCFFDDDDIPSDSYIYTLLRGIDTDPDNISLLGVITTDGKDPQLFEHSIKYKEYKTTDNEIKYERYPNHLNCIRSSIAKQFKFPEINHGEDTDWATQIFNSGLLKTEYYTDKILYYYKYITNK